MNLELEKFAGELAELRTESEVLHGLMHHINMYASITMNAERMQEIIGAICAWSYAHRQGNGEFTDQEQQHLIDNRFQKIKQILCITEKE